MIRRDFLASGIAVLAAGALPAHAGSLANSMADFTASNRFYGIVQQARNGKPLRARTYGYANIEDRRTMKLETPFGVASISKWFTAITLLRLAEQGRVNLDAPIRTYLPAFRADTGGRVTLRHLLCNASGIPNNLTPAAKADPGLLTAGLSTDEAIDRFCQGAPTFAPMERFDYAVTNWIILLGVVEKVTGQPFKTAVDQLTLSPLGLRDTRADDQYAQDEKTAISYATIDPPQRRISPRPAYTVAAGGYYSTAADLLRAAHRVFDTGFLKEDSLNQLLGVQIEEYALGGRVKTLLVDGQPRRFAWETGNTMGFRSVLAHRLDTSETLIILNNTNLSQKALDDLAIDLFGAIRAG